MRIHSTKVNKIIKFAHSLDLLVCKDDAIYAALQSAGEASPAEMVLRPPGQFIPVFVRKKFVCRLSSLPVSVVDRHRFDADPELTFHLGANPDPNPSLRFIHVGKSEFCFYVLLTAVLVYIVLSFSSAS
jgi:hypothetical protein